MFTDNLTFPHKGKEYTVEELLTLRNEIDQMLPAAELKDIDLNRELVLQYMQVKSLQSSVMDDDGTPANQKAQVANSCASTLSQLTKMQAELFDAERLKTVEQILIRTLQKFPEMSEAFLVEYEDALNG